MDKGGKEGVRILVVDDDMASRKVVCELLSREGYSVEISGDARDALSRHLEAPFDLVVSDIRMPGMDGLELLKALKNTENSPLVILITAFGDMEGAARALQWGAFEYLSKPFRPAELKGVVLRAVEERQTPEMAPAPSVFQKTGLIGRSPEMVRLYREIARAAKSEASVLISGESGSGKELVARSIHQYSPRKEGPFISVNCGAFNDQLLESELFGHEKGAFTGAERARLGLFREAEGGTLFLDEVAEVSQRMQVQLLRVLQEREVRPVGSEKNHSVDSRVVAATNRNLRTMVDEGEFREDLLYRVMVVEIEVPPLRNRRDDIPLLVQHFLARHGPSDKRAIDLGALSCMVAYDWPGNVRQLENTIARAIALTPGDRITKQDLPEEVALAEKEETSSEKIQTISERNRLYAQEILAQAGGNKSKAAGLLGVDRKTLYRLLKEKK